MFTSCRIREIRGGSKGDNMFYILKCKLCIIMILISFVFQEELLVLERILLQSIKFDLQVDHPYAFLLKYAKSLKGTMYVAT